MKIYHTSPEEITKINSGGVFGESLCFADTPYSMSGGEVITYSIEIEESEIIDAEDLDEDDAPETIAHISNVLECDEDDALEYLTGEKIHSDYEMDWFVQGMMGDAAKEAGYKAARSNDEQGTVYIVPMLNRENDLVKEG